MRSLTVVLALAFAAGSGAAFAAQHSIMQKGKVFSESAIAIKKGDTVVFVNDDNIAHNILSTTPGHEFNLGAVAAGDSAQVIFDKSGEIGVQCAIHPRMKLTVTVAD
jgi:plastocyanin